MIRIPNGLSKSETDLYKYLFTKCDELIREGIDHSGSDTKRGN